MFLQYISSPYFELPECTDDTQQSFDRFYDAVLGLLNHFHPVRYVTITSRDPDFITPHIKAMLRRKYRLTRAGREEETSALAQKIGKAIKRYNITRLSNVDHKCGTKEMWAAVRELSGRRAKASHME